MNEDYCSQRINYAEVRGNMGHAFAEKASELHEWLALLQSLSKEAVGILGKLETHCGPALQHAQTKLDRM